MSTNQYALDLSDCSTQDDFDRLAARAIRVIGADRIWRLDPVRIRRLNLALGSIQAKKKSIEAVADHELRAAFETVVDDGSMPVHILVSNNGRRAIFRVA